MSSELCIIITVFLICMNTGYAQPNITADDLVLMQMVIRHGSTSPSVLYPKDPYPASLWKEGLNDLTMVGKFRSFALGFNMRYSLRDVITSSPNELEVMSCSDKPSVKTAQSFVTGMYHPTKYWEVVEGFPWQPIYIAYDRDMDKYLCNPKEARCLSADIAYRKSLIEDSQHIMEKYQNLINLWRLGSGSELENLMEIYSLCHTLETEGLYNLTLPDWALIYWDEMKYLHDLAVSTAVKSKPVLRMRGGPLIGLTLDAMMKKTMNETNKKIMVYVTHGFNIAAFLSALGIYNDKSMPEGTGVYIQLYEKYGDYYVRYSFMNSTSPDRLPYQIFVLEIPGCGEFCPLDYIIEKTKDIIPRDWEKECQHI